MLNLTPSQKGAIAEAAFAAAVTELGLTVLRPLSEGRRYDLVVDLEPQLLRVQCKLARRCGAALVVGLQTNRCTPGGYVSSSYTAREIDAIGVYSPDVRRCLLIPIAQAQNRRSIQLRMEPCRNGQREGVKWAQDYELKNVIESLRASQPSGWRGG
jgi:PD-(D/E)XK endonuclease